jgi:cobaltochelatase CobT
VRKLVDVCRPWIEGKAARRFDELNERITDQEGFAKALRGLIADLDLLDEEAESSDSADAESQDQEGEGGESQSQSDGESSESASDEQAEQTSTEGESGEEGADAQAAEADDDELAPGGAEEADAAGRVRRPNPRGDNRPREPAYRA